MLYPSLTYWYKLIAIIFDIFSSYLGVVNFLFSQEDARLLLRGNKLILFLAILAFYCPTIKPGENLSSNMPKYYSEIIINLMK